MTETVRHWIMSHLVRVAEEHGHAYWKHGTCTKTVQIIEVMPYQGTTWVLISDKRHYMHARLSQNALDEFRRQPNVGHRRITECKGTVASIQFELKLDQVVWKDGKRLADPEHLFLEIKGMHINGAFGMARFGDPTWIENDEDIKLWVQRLRHRGTSGDILKQRKEQREKEEKHKHASTSRVEQTQLPWDERLIQERINWKEFDDPRVFKWHTQVPPEDLEALAKLDSYSRDHGASTEVINRSRKATIIDALASPLPSQSQSKSSSQSQSQGSYRPSSSRQQATPLPSSPSDVAFSRASSPLGTVGEEDWPPSPPSRRHIHLKTAGGTSQMASQKEIAQSRYPTAPPSAYSIDDHSETPSLKIPEPTTSQPHYPPTSQLARFMPAPTPAQRKTAKPCPEPPPITPIGGVDLQKKNAKLVFEDDDEAKSTQSQSDKVSEQNTSLSSFPTMVSSRQPPLEKTSCPVSETHCNSSSLSGATEAFFVSASSSIQPVASTSAVELPPLLHDTALEGGHPLSLAPPADPTYPLSHQPLPSPLSPLAKSSPLYKDSLKLETSVKSKRAVSPTKTIPEHSDIDSLASSQGEKAHRNTVPGDSSSQSCDSLQGGSASQRSGNCDSDKRAQTTGSIQKAGLVSSVPEVEQHTLPGSPNETDHGTLSLRNTADARRSPAEAAILANSTSEFRAVETKKKRRRATKRPKANSLLTDYALYFKQSGKYPKITTSRHPVYPVITPGLEDVMNKGKWTSCQVGPSLGQVALGYKVATKARAQTRVDDHKDQSLNTEAESEIESIGKRSEPQATGGGKEDRGMGQPGPDGEDGDRAIPGDGDRVYAVELSVNKPSGGEVVALADVNLDAAPRNSESRDDRMRSIEEEQKAEIAAQPMKAADVLNQLDDHASSAEAASSQLSLDGPDVSTAATLGNPSQKISDLEDTESLLHLSQDNDTLPIELEDVEESAGAEDDPYGETAAESSQQSITDEGCTHENVFETASNAILRQSSSSSRPFKPRSQETDIAPDSQPEPERNPEPESSIQVETTSFSQTADSLFGSYSPRAKPTDPTADLTPALQKTVEHNEEDTHHIQPSNSLFGSYKGITTSPLFKAPPMASSSSVTLNILREPTYPAGHHDAESWAKPSFMRDKGRTKVPSPLPTTSEVHNDSAGLSGATLKRKRAGSDTTSHEAEGKRQKHKAPTMSPEPDTQIKSVLSATLETPTSRRPGVRANKGKAKQTISLSADPRSGTDAIRPQPVFTRKLLGGLGGNVRQNTPMARTASYAELKNMIYRSGVYRELEFVPPSLSHQ